MDIKMRSLIPKTRTERQVAPKAPIWVALAIGLVVVAAALGAGIWYLLRVREINKAPHAPQSKVIRVDDRKWEEFTARVIVAPGRFDEKRSAARWESREPCAA